MNINLIEYFENTVDLYPDKLAIVDDSSKLNFREVKRKAIIIASKIASRHKLFNRPIAIYLPKSNDSVVSFIATLYSGNCYAPLDTKNPIERIKSILEVLKPLCILTNSNFIENLRRCHLDIDIINIDEIEFEDPNKRDFNHIKCVNRLY